MKIRVQPLIETPPPIDTSSAFYIALVMSISIVAVSAALLAVLG